MHPKLNLGSCHYFPASWLEGGGGLKNELRPGFETKKSEVKVLPVEKERISVIHGWIWVFFFVSGTVHAEGHISVGGFAKLQSCKNVGKTW